MSVKQLDIRRREIWLAPKNPAYEPFRVEENMHFEILGKVINTIHKTPHGKQ
jgi:SOS-response transcriptional repressor LexA